MSEEEEEKQLTPDEIRRLLQVLEEVERLDKIVAALSKIIQEKMEKEGKDAK